MRIGDLDALFCQLWRKADPFKEQPLVKPSAVWSKAATMAREAPTIDPETIPIVCKLREELARVTAERDAAYSDFKLIEEECLCSVCDHQNEPDLFCADCKGSPYVATDTFKWRGQQKEE